MKPRINIAAAIVMAVISLTGCPEKEKGFAVDAKATRLNETACLLAGRGVSQDSPLSQYTKNRYYESYKSEIVPAWNRFQKPNLDKIKKWWPGFAPKSYNDTVLYPFSGPDIINALVFFPEADLYVLFGLEPPGIIPDPYGMSQEQINSGLNGLKKSLGTIFRVNFFKTESMAVEITDKSFNGITGIMMFFLSTNGYTVLGAEKIVVDGDSKIRPAVAADDKIRWQSPPRSRVPGVEIAFKKPGGRIQRIRYYMLNVIDEALASSSPNFLPYLAGEGRFTTLLKSASYLMHNDNVKFTKIRSFILKNSDYVLQDDSGIPMRYFPASEWKLRFHGIYDQPISLFRNRAQKDLREAFKKQSTGMLPFSYGYDYKINESNLMSAERKK
ncbi:MAG: hypothetical protein MUD12_14340 [Spirochaetes bacterium]|jgi:hypothetical protein|nr:hypothetical protein [Spirochaetota bacterium]